MEISHPKTISFASTENAIKDAFAQVSTNFQIVDTRITTLQKALAELTKMFQLSRTQLPTPPPPTVNNATSIVQQLTPKPQNPKSREPQIQPLNPEHINASTQPTKQTIILPNENLEAAHDTSFVKQDDTSIIERPAHQSNVFGDLDDPDNPFLRLIGEKMVQIQDRLEQNEIEFQGNKNTVIKKFNQVSYETSENASQIRKVSNQLDMCLKKIQAISEDLLDYKLKRDSKYQQIISNAAASSEARADDAFKKIVIDKFRNLSAQLEKSLARDQYEFEKEQLAKKLAAMNERIESKIGLETYDNLLSFVEKTRKQTQAASSKYIQSTLKLRRMPSFAAQVDKQEDQQTNKNPSEMEVNLIKNITTLTQEIESKARILQEIQDKMHELGNKQKENAAVTQNLKENLQGHLDKYNQNEEDMKKYLKEMNKAYEAKIGEVEIKLHDFIEKKQKEDRLKRSVSARKRHLSYVENSAIGTEGDSVLGVEKKSMAVLSNQDQIQEISAVNKKVSKLQLKFMQHTEQVNKVIAQLVEDMAVIKTEIDKKVDAENNRKIMVFLETKINQMVQVLNSLQGVPAENGESLIAKKNWSCLVCDKSLEKYEGKLGDIKFTSMLPTSFNTPRIGGYYKQHQNEKEYKKVFFSDRKAEASPSMPRVDK